MIITLNRISDNKDSTIGYLQVDGHFFCFTLEDQFNKTKIRGETRIPEGTYKLSIRKEDSPLTLQHRKNYGAWFKYHIEISGVENFKWIYIHSGNDDDHTDGCLLLGDTLFNHLVTPKSPLGQSVQALKRFYDLVYPIIDKGQEVLIDIKQRY